MQFRSVNILHVLFVSAASLAMSATSPIFAQVGGPPIPAPDPAAELATFKVADGFEVTLFAAEPMVAKPIQMNFDPQGRLWVASSSVYPQVKPGEPANDKIVVLEDVDGDGKADKSTVFTDGLLIPTAVIPGDGGAYVCNSTEVVHFIDKDGDLKADDFRVVLSGFGTEDTHHIIHTLRWGPDQRLYFNQSVYIHSHVETPYGTQRLYGSGVWRYRPESDELQIFSRGMWNPWGHTINRWGTSFCTDGAGDGGIHYVFPGASFVTAVGIEKTVQGLNPGSPKYCGAELVNGRALPEDWQDNIITNDFRANRIVRFKVTDAANGYYTSKLVSDVMTSTSPYFRPIDIKQGPDGAIYIADWCNQIINHGEVDFRDPRRDKVHGRIWRLAPKGMKPLDRPKLVGQPVAVLLDDLKSPEDWTRQQTKMVLHSLGAKAVIPALADWVKKIDKSDPQADHLRLEALWMYQGLDVPEPALLKELLNSKNPDARAAAIRVIPDWNGRLPGVTDLLAERIVDEHPRVRLETVRALARILTSSSMEIAVRALTKPMDLYLDFGLWMAANDLKPYWLPEFQAGRLTFGGQTNQMNFALQAIKSPDALNVLIGQLGKGDLPASQRGDIFDLIAAVGTAQNATAVFDAAVRPETDAPTKVRALTALERGARLRNVLPANADASRVNALLDDPDPSIRAAAIAFAGVWKPAETRDRFLQIAQKADASPAVRSAAISALANGGAESGDLLRKIADSADAAYATKLQAVAALAHVDIPDAAKRAAALLSATPADADPAPLIEGLIQREGGADALADALKGKPVPKDAAKLSLRVINTTGRDAGSLTGVLREAAGLGATPKAPTPDEIKAIIAKMQESGDPKRGEQVFRRSDTGCFNCHAIAGAGTAVGPDLRAIGASSPADYIVESILVPSKSIKEGYQSLIVATKKNEVVSGIKVSADDKELILRDATHDRIVIPIDQIRRQKDGGSLMPNGLADTLTEGEFLDLLSFLSALGKPGPFAAGPELLVRRWQILDGPLTDPKLLQSAAADQLAWKPVYSLVTGDLPLDAIASPSGKAGPLTVRAKFEVVSAGKIGIGLNSPAGLEMLVDGKPIEAAKEMTVDLPSGVHTLTLSIDRSKRGADPLRVEFKDLPAGGHAQPLGGR